VDSVDRIRQMILSVQQQLYAIERELEQVKQPQPSAYDLELDMFTPAEQPPTEPGLYEVMGGQETNDFPDCCAVGNDTGYYCSGTLIAPQLVVTAKHCQYVTCVFLKGNDITKPECGETLRVQKEIVHPALDLKLLLLEKPSAVTPRKVLQTLSLASSKVATVAGFGRIDAAGLVGYGKKRQVDVPIVTMDITSNDALKYGCLQGWEMVAGHQGLQRDTCKGDSGGPLYIHAGNDQYALLGVTSRGVRNGFTTCGDGGIYVCLDRCVDWIEQVTGIKLPA
jgi:hypothetical protein